MPTVQSIVRQALGVVIGGLIVAAMTLAPANAQEQLTVTSLNGPLSIDETYDTDKRITYQGMLLDALGQPVPNGSYYMVFSIYDSATSTQPLAAGVQPQRQHRRQRDRRLLHRVVGCEQRRHSR